MGLFPSQAYAAPGDSPQEYTTSYNVQNVYSNYTLVFAFTDLTAAQSYTWRIQLLNLDGSYHSDVTSFTRSGVTGTSWFFNEWPDVYGPYRVIDNFNHVLSRGFLAPDISNSAFASVSGYTDLDNRTIMKAVGAPFSPTMDSAYTDRSTDSYNPEYYTVVPGANYFLLHYRFVTSDDPPNSADITQIKSLFTGNNAATFYNEELYNWNIGDGWVSDSDYFSQNFVVVSTNGHCPFCDPTRAVASFPNSNNPMYLTLPYDAYDYGRIYADTSVEPGESIFIVAKANPEWTFKLEPNPVVSLTTIKGTFTNQTSQVWEALNGGGVGTGDTDILTGAADASTGLTDAFKNEYKFSFQSRAAFGSADLDWVHCASNYNFPHTTPNTCFATKALFVVQSIAAVPTPGTGAGLGTIVNGKLAGINFFAQFDKIVMLLVSLLGMFAVARWTRAGKKIYYFFYIGITSMLVFFGWFDLWINIILVISIALMFYFVFQPDSNETTNL